MRFPQIGWCDECEYPFPQGTEHEHPLEDRDAVPADAIPVQRVGWVEAEMLLWHEYAELIQRLPFPDHQTVVKNLGLLSTPGLIRRLLMFWHLTSLVEDVPGAWCEFGVQWGRDLAWLSSFKTLQPERWVSTKIAGFDTFTGHIGTSPKDGDHEFVKPGWFATPIDYPAFLQEVLSAHHRAYPVYAGVELIKGDVRNTLPVWLKAYPGPVALAYLDLDLYDPTKFVLEQVWERIPSGGVIGLDEFVVEMYPGETVAVSETLGVDAEWRWSPFGPWAYLIKP